MSGTVKKFKQQFRKAMTTGDGTASSSSPKPRNKPTDSDVGKKLTPESFRLATTAWHGLPGPASCAAFEPIQKLLAIGTREGIVKVFGSSDVECTLIMPGGAKNVNALKFSVNDALISVCDFVQIDLWNLKLNVPAVNRSVRFKEEITHIHLPTKSTWMYVGTRLGNVNLVTIESFSISSYVVNWTLVMPAGIPENRLLESHPGHITAIEEDPVDCRKLLITHAFGNCVIWDSKAKKVVKRFGAPPQSWPMFAKTPQTNPLHQQHLNTFRCPAIRAAAWSHDGKHFVLAHDNGTVSVWNASVDSRPDYIINGSSSSFGPSGSPALPSLGGASSGAGPSSGGSGGGGAGSGHAAQSVSSSVQEPREPVTSVIWASADDDKSFIIYAGGSPKADNMRTVFISQAKTQKMFCFDSKIVDVLCVASSPWPNAVQNPQALIVVLEDDIAVVDLLSPGYPFFPIPYPFSLQKSQVTCMKYYTGVPAEFMAALRNAGSKQNVFLGKSDKDFPISGGMSGINKEHLSLDLVLTGHESGLVHFWDISSLSLVRLYTVDVVPLFSSTLGLTSEDTSISHVHLCPESRCLTIAVGNGDVLFFAFSLISQKINVQKVTVKRQTVKSDSKSKSSKSNGDLGHTAEGASSASTSTSASASSASHASGGDHSRKSFSATVMGKLTAGKKKGRKTLFASEQQQHQWDMDMADLLSMGFQEEWCEEALSSSNSVSLAASALMERSAAARVDYAAHEAKRLAKRKPPIDKKKPQKKIKRLMELGFSEEICNEMLNKSATMEDTISRLFSKANAAKIEIDQKANPDAKKLASVSSSSSLAPVPPPPATPSAPVAGAPVTDMELHLANLNYAEAASNTVVTMKGAVGFQLRLHYVVLEKETGRNIRNINAVVYNSAWSLLAVADEQGLTLLSMKTFKPVFLLSNIELPINPDAGSEAMKSRNEITCLKLVETFVTSKEPFPTPALLVGTIYGSIFTFIIKINGKQVTLKSGIVINFMSPSRVVSINIVDPDGNIVEAPALPWADMSVFEQSIADELEEEERDSRRSSVSGSPLNRSNSNLSRSSSMSGLSANSSLHSSATDLTSAESGHEFHFLVVADTRHARVLALPEQKRLHKLPIDQTILNAGIVRVGNDLAFCLLTDKGFVKVLALIDLREMLVAQYVDKSVERIVASGIATSGRLALISPFSQLKRCTLLNNEASEALNESYSKLFAPFKQLPPKPSSGIFKKNTQDNASSDRNSLFKL